jgi:hypothetical protein
MRACARLLVVVCLLAPMGLRALGADAAPILAAAREALGGDKKLSAVKTFSVTGRTKKIQGNTMVPVEFEVYCELPDKYVRKDEVPAQESAPATNGFNGDDLIQIPPFTLPARPGGPAPAPAQLDAMRKARATSAKQDFTRLTLGMFAASFSSYPLTFTAVGQAEAPQGKADVIDVTGPGNFTIRFFVSTTTHLPIMVSWTAMAPPNSPVKPPENRIYYSEYHDADGLQWPYKLRRAIGADTVEETTFDRFKLNAKIDPKKFEVVK